MNKGEKLFLVGRKGAHCYEYLQPHFNGHIIVKDGRKVKYVSDLWLTIAVSESYDTEQEALKVLWLQRYDDLSLLQEQAGVTQHHIDAWEWYKKDGWRVAHGEGKRTIDIISLDNILKLYNEQRR